MRRSRKFASILTIGILALGATACGGNSDSGSDSSGSGGGSGAKSDIKVGMAYDVGGRGDQSFNDSAAAGLDKAKTDFGLTPTSPRPPTARPSPLVRSGS